MSIRTLALLTALAAGITAGAANAYYDPATGRYVNPYTANGYHPQTVGNLYPGEGYNAPVYGFAVGPGYAGPAYGYRYNGASYYSPSFSGGPLLFLGLGGLGQRSTTNSGRTTR